MIKMKTFELNEKIRNLSPYEPVTGECSIRLDANESCFDLPEEIKMKIAAEIQNVQFNRYPDPNAKDLCNAFANYYNISPELVTAGNGSDELISIIINAFLMKGDKIVITQPDFSMYRFYSEISEVVCVNINKSSELSIKIDNLIEVVKSEDARAVIFSNPCNPTSRGLKAEDVVTLINSVDALVVLDEAYMDFWDESLLDTVEEFDNLIILRTASKAAGMAALRLGFAIANPKLTRVIRSVKSPYNVNTLSQVAGTVVFNEREYLEKCKRTILSSKKALYNDLVSLARKNKNKIIPIEGVSNFVLLKTSLAKVIYAFLQNNGISVKLMDDYLRISAGTQHENKVLINALKEFFK